MFQALFQIEIYFLFLKVQFYYTCFLINLVANFYKLHKVNKIKAQNKTYVLFLLYILFFDFFNSFKIGHNSLKKVVSSAIFGFNVKSASNALLSKVLAHLVQITVLKFIFKI